MRMNKTAAHHLSMTLLCCACMLNVFITTLMSQTHRTIILLGYWDWFDANETRSVCWATNPITIIFLG